MFLTLLVATFPISASMSRFEVVYMSSIALGAAAFGIGWVAIRFVLPWLAGYALRQDGRR